ncbi:MAG: DUF177 domain-containing protein [Thermodesulfobacteriota bacterium]
MLININEALEGTEPLEFTLDGEEIIGQALIGRGEPHGEYVPDSLDFSFSSPVSVRLDLTSSGREVIIDGSLKTGLTLQCSRCLKDYSLPLDSKFLYTAPLAKEAGEAKERTVRSGSRKGAKKCSVKAEVEPSDLTDGESKIERELAHIKDGELNLTALLLEEITLLLPSKPLCKKSCKGLCLSCGTDLNAAKCKCGVHVDIDPRLNKLKEFKSSQ